jgi:hypothetical protein
MELMADMYLVSEKREIVNSIDAKFTTGLPVLFEKANTVVKGQKQFVSTEAGDSGFSITARLLTITKVISERMPDVKKFWDGIEEGKLLKFLNFLQSKKANGMKCLCALHSLTSSLNVSIPLLIVRHLDIFH